MKNLSKISIISIILASLALVCLQCSDKDTGPVYGKIGFSKITKKDLDKTLKYLSRVNPMSRSQYEGDEGLQKLIDQHVENEIIYLDGIKKGYGKDTTVTREINTYLLYLILKKYDQQILDARAGLPEKEFEKYYQKHREDYKVRAKVLLKHILCKTADEARAILKEIKGGAVFEDLAEERSTDTQTARNKGHLGWVTEGAAVPYLGKLPAFSEAAFKLDKGDISEPVKTEKGFHIIKVEDKKEASYKELDDVRTQIRDALIATDENIKAYYGKHKADFGAPEERKISHILVKDEATAKKVLAKIRKGASFERLVKKYSQCPGTRDKKGNLGFVKKGTYIANVGKETDFEKAAFALAEPGDVSDVVRTQKGYHIIKLTEIKPAQEKTFEEAKFAVRTKLLEARKKAGRKKMLADLRKKYKVSIAENLEDAEVYARIGSEKVTKADLDRTMNFLAKIEPMAHEKYGGAKNLKALVEKHVEQQVIFKDGLRRGMDQEESIADEITMYRRYLVMKEYRARELDAKAGLPDRQIRNYYKEHKEDFKIKARAHLKHILCKTKKDAQKVLAEIKSGIPFDSLVVKYTIDSQTRNTGGNLGWTTEGGAVPYLGKVAAITDAAFALKEGQYSKPIQTDKGFHVLKIEKLVPGTYKSLKEVTAQIRDELLITRDDLQKYYDEHKNEYLEKEQRKISHIQCTTEKQAKRVLARIKKGMDWKKAAKRYSQDKNTAAKGGALSYIRRNSYIRYVGREPGFENAAFALAKAGDISEPVKTAKGYHIIRLEEVKPQRQKSLDEVTSLIKSRLLNQKKADGVKLALEKLKKKYRVKLFEIQRTEKELFDLAQKALEDKKYQKAIDYYGRITEDYPKSDRAYQAIFLVGWVYSEYLKDYDQADVYFKEVIAKYPDSDLTDDAEWMIKNQRNPNALDFIIKQADSTRAAEEAKAKAEAKKKK